MNGHDIEVMASFYEAFVLIHTIFAYVLFLYALVAFALDAWVLALRKTPERATKANNIFRTVHRFAVYWATLTFMLGIAAMIALAQIGSLDNLWWLLLIKLAMFLGLMATMPMFGSKGLRERKKLLESADNEKAAWQATTRRLWIYKLTTLGWLTLLILVASIQW